MIVSCSTCDRKLTLFYIGLLKPWYSCGGCGRYRCYDCDKQLSTAVDCC